MSFMVREIAVDENGAREVERYGPYRTEGDARAYAATRAGEYDLPGDEPGRYDGKDDWWGRDEGEAVTHRFEIAPVELGTHTRQDPNGFLWWGRLGA